jgi:hypothetical protein
MKRSPQSHPGGCPTARLKMAVCGAKHQQSSWKLPNTCLSRYSSVVAIFLRDTRWCFGATPKAVSEGLAAVRGRAVEHRLRSACSVCASRNELKTRTGERGHHMKITKAQSLRHHVEKWLAPTMSVRVTALWQSSLRMR